MKCHYEVLNISQEAELPEIKSAYRKAALKWHPDKNLNNEDFAKEQFQLVQQAYEVLSDPQERAWYDKHRHQILYGAGSQYEDNSLDVFPYFTSTCFKGYTDDPGGFYAVYGELFDKIINEDMQFCEDKEEFCDIPRFGTSNSDYEQIVAPFYAYWLSYATKKTYVWLDKYEADSSTERRVFKLMEKENKKIRQKAKKERNEEIRSLVAFVRKRDKRVQQHTKLLEQRKVENREKQKELTKKHRLNRKQELDKSTGAEAEWSKFDNVQSQLEEIEKKILQEFQDDDSNSEDEEADNSLYCVACNKVFKTVKAFGNHETSKKHKEKVAMLKEIMQEEDGGGEGSDDNLEDISDFEDILSESNSERDESCKKAKKQKKKKKKTLKVDVTDEDEETEEKISTEEPEEVKEQEIENEELINNESVQIDDSDAKIPQKKKKPKKVVENGQINNNIKKKQRKKDKQEVDEDLDTSHVCVSCKANFPSKNKLFDHLKKTGHSVHVPKSAGKPNRNK